MSPTPASQPPLRSLIPLHRPPVLYAAGVVSQSAQALSKLLLGCAISNSYSALHLLRLKLLKSQDSHMTAAAAQTKEAAAAAIAADWACLSWLLQTAPEDLVKGLKVQWQKQQVPEFVTWVRPAAELSTVRSKTAAKVCCSMMCWDVLC